MTETMTTDLVPMNTGGSRYSLAEINSIGEVFAKSGYFKDASDVAKAITKVLAGQELGLGPMQSMTGIHIVQGKPTLSASLVGAMIKRSGRYDYRVKQLDDKACTLVFFERGDLVGESTFTLEDAKSAGLLSNPTWKNYPRNMLHSRALTNGARWYCPDVFGGAIYTPDEMGAPINPETGEALVVEETPPPPPPAATEEQIAWILELEQTLTGLGVFTQAQFEKALRKDYGKETVSKLSLAEAEELLGRLRAKLDEQTRDAVPAAEGGQSQFQAPEGALAQ